MSLFLFRKPGESNGQKRDKFFAEFLSAKNAGERRGMQPTGTLSAAQGNEARAEARARRNSTGATKLKLYFIYGFFYVIINLQPTANFKFK